MKTLATTLIATCCFALMGTQAQAIELLVRVLPEDVKQSAQNAEDACWTGYHRALYTSVPPSQQAAKYNVAGCLGVAANYSYAAGYFAGRADDLVAIIAILPAYDPQRQELIREFWAYCEASYSYAQYSRTYTQIALYQPTSAALCAYPAFEAATETMQRADQLLGQDMETTADEYLERGFYGLF